MGTIYFNGKDLCENFNMNVIGRGTYGAPARDIEQVHVPGRNGDLLFDNGGFLNQTVTYPECSILENFPFYGAQLRNFLLSAPGYHELRDTYDPRYYRLAEFRGPFEPDVHTARNNDSAVFDLSFNCKPFRYLRSRYSPVIYVGGTRISRDSYVVIPASVDGSYYLSFVNNGSEAVPFTVISTDKDDRDTTLLSISVAGGASESGEITTASDNILYVLVRINKTTNIEVYSGQRLIYSYNGETGTTKLYNDSFLAAAPLLTLVNFGGSIAVEEDTITIGAGYTKYSCNIDCEEYAAYSGQTSYDYALSVSGNFPSLAPGLNTIVCSAFDPTEDMYIRCASRLRYL